jgi:hypothetical protein
MQTKCFLENLVRNKLELNSEDFSNAIKKTKMLVKDRFKVTYFELIKKLFLKMSIFLMRAEKLP